MSDLYLYRKLLLYQNLMKLERQILDLSTKNKMYRRESIFTKTKDADPWKWKKNFSLKNFSFS